MASNWEKKQNQKTMARRRARFRTHSGATMTGPSWEKAHNRMVMRRQRARFGNAPSFRPARAPSSRPPVAPSQRL